MLDASHETSTVHMAKLVEGRRHNLFCMLYLQSTFLGRFPRRVVSPTLGIVLITTLLNNDDRGGGVLQVR